MSIGSVSVGSSSLLSRLFSQDPLDTMAPHPQYPAQQLVSHRGVHPEPLVPVSQK